MELEELSNEELIMLYREGNEEAREYFFEKNKKFVYMIAARYAGNCKTKEDMQDIVSEANIGMLKAFNKYDTSKGIKFTTFAGQVIHNEILMYLRKLKKANGLNAESFNKVIHSHDKRDITIEDTLMADNASHDLHLQTSLVMEKFFNNASNIEKTVYDLHIKKDLSQPQVAKRLGVSPQYISKVFGKIRKQLVI